MKEKLIRIYCVVLTLAIMISFIFAPRPKPCPEITREQTTTEKLWDVISDLQKQGVIRIDIKQNRAVMLRENNEVVSISYGPIPFEIWNKEVEKYKRIND